MLSKIQTSKKLKLNLNSFSISLLDSNAYEKKILEYCSIRVSREVYY